MEEFITQNSNAIFALIGTLLGTCVTGAINYFTKTKETKLRLAEKLLNKKIEAHESLIRLIGLIRSMVLKGGQTVDGDLIRFPKIMESRESMEIFLDQFNLVQSNCDRWFSANLKREMSFFLDYFVNLNEYSRLAEDEAIQDAGILIRTDFILIANSLEDIAHDFFNKDMIRLKYKTDRKWHKYPIKKTMKRLGQTEFYKNKDKIREILYKKCT